MKIVVLDGYTLVQNDLSWDALCSLGEVRIFDRTYPSDVVARIADAEIVLTNKVVIDEKVFEGCPSIRYVGVMATGYNVVDLNAARKRNIMVTNIPSYSTDSVAQHVFAFLLNVSNSVGEYNESVHQGDWKSSPDFSYMKSPLFELSGKTMGIIGFGAIGKKVACIAAAFGMNVIAYSRTKEKVDECPYVKYVSSDDLFKESDVISLHCPLTESTENIICKDNILKMKKGVILINTARGLLIDEDDLIWGINEKIISKYCADVLDVEPMKKNCLLNDDKNCILTPHIAWATENSRKRLMKILVENVKCFIGGNPCNVVV